MSIRVIKSPWRDDFVSDHLSRTVKDLASNSQGEGLQVDLCKAHFRNEALSLCKGS